MDKILSQDEVDALLRGVTGGDVDTTPDPEEPADGPVPYDLGNQEWIVRGRCLAKARGSDRDESSGDEIWRFY